MLFQVKKDCEIYSGQHCFSSVVLIKIWLWLGEEVEAIKKKNSQAEVTWIQKEETGNICVRWKNYRPEKLYQKFAEDLV